MRKFSLLAVIALILSLTISVVAFAGPKSKDADKGNQDPLRALYENKTRFQMLSGAAQNLLYHKYGMKGAPGESVPLGNQKSKPSSPSTVLPNVLVNDPTADATDQDTQSETTIVLAGPNIVAGFNDSGSFIGGASKFTGWSYSTDGGSTFTDGGALPTDPTGEGDAGDPVMARDNTSGRIYFSTLGFNTLSKLQVFRSDDNGVSWMVPVGAGNVGGGSQQDKEWITVDNAAGSGQGNVYMTWRSFGDGVYFVRSTDAGATWSAGIKIADQGSFNVQGPFVVTAPNHDVHILWLDQSAGSGTPNIIKTRKSTDQGVTWSAPVNVATLMTTGVNGGLGLNGGFRTNAFPHASISQANGDIYVVWNDDVAGPDAADIFYSSSTDGGATWSAKVDITTSIGSSMSGGSLNDDYMPTIATTPDGSHAFITWYDRELDPNNSLIDRFGVIATKSGGTLTFGPQFRISSSNWPVVIGQDPVINTVYMGDYDQAVADNSFFYGTWGDNRNGDAFHANQPDVRFAKIPLAGPGALLSQGAVTVDDSTGNNNGTIDFNECVNINVAIHNSGTSTATGVSGTLSTSTPNVTVSAPTSAYPDIAAGTSQTNSTPFQIQTSPSFACGTSIDFTLTVTTASDGVFVFNFSVGTGSVGAPVQFDNNTVTPINDVSTTDIPFAVSGFTGIIGKVTLSWYGTHTWDGDLDISLISPNGTVTVPLTSDNGGSGDNYGAACSPESSRTTFDDAAATSITQGTAPFLGSYRPEGFLSDFNGLTGTDVNGTWTLRIIDDAGQDSGTYFCGSLFLSPSACTDGGGACAGPVCTYFDNYNDGIRTVIEVKPSVTESGGFVNLTPAGKKAIGTNDPVFAGCSTCTITHNIQFTGGAGGKGWMLTHRIDKNNQMEILFKFDTGKVVIKERFGGQIKQKVKANFVITPSTNYQIQAIYDGTTYTLKIDGVTILSLNPTAPLPTGGFGWQVKNETMLVDDSCVN